ncbi:MAG TPA: hypothetical protein VF761_13975 [Gemmatimonadaceae bacterium]
MAGPFELHLREAIALNRERAPLYVAASDGASRRISITLVALEWLLLPVARRFDRADARYRDAGVSVLEDLFVRMADAPPFVEQERLPESASGIAPLEIRALRRHVAGALAADDFAGVAAALAAALGTLAATPGLHCMVRHLLESAHRIATLAPERVRRAEEHALPTPAPLLGRLLRLHLSGLAAARMLDRWARPLQLAGIPILARDLPPIPIHTDGASGPASRSRLSTRA